MMYQAEAIKPLPGVKPYPALELAGRDVYVREGCYNCHSQMVRTLRFETERYGHYSLAGESVYDRPHQWGSKRTGQDLARVGGRYSDDWHRVHLIDPRAVVPEFNMPGFPWLLDNQLDGRQGAAHTPALRGGLCTTAPHCVARSTADRTGRAWAATVPTTGTGWTLSIRARWCPCPTCPGARGCRTTGSTAGRSPRT